MQIPSIFYWFFNCIISISVFNSQFFSHSYETITTNLIFSIGKIPTVDFFTIFYVHLKVIGMDYSRNID